MKKYYNPVNIVKTDNWKLEVAKYLKKYDVLSPIIITSPGNRKRLDLDSIFHSKSIFSFVNSNPDFEDCSNVISFCKGNSFDSVIAIGGGSVMDLAKVVLAYICTDQSNIIKLISYKEKFPREIPSIFLPTTHGTASEVTMWGTIWNIKEKKKYSISNPSLYPTTAILDGNLTLTLPLKISIITIMDALSHSFEAIWNKNANPISTDYAIKAISTILNNINSFKNNPNRIDVRNCLLEASTVAGLAFSNTTTAAAHSISYPLTMYYGMPHGVASSITLIPLLDINEESIKKPLTKIYENNKLNKNELKKEIKNIPSSIISYKLNEWGVQKKELAVLASRSFTKGRMENNIVNLNQEDVHSILKIIY